ncbi:MAG: hypothetical protein JJE18_08190 [Eubacteriaceae bacterium]|nr:hypothetical protein [Eubacteriaceae bacterium]
MKTATGITPTLRLVSGALRNTGQGITKVFTDNPDLSNLRVLAVPQLFQMIRYWHYLRRLKKNQ